MSKGETPKKGDYEVGYGKPPRHSQFVPGQSGFKGRKKNQRKETQAEIIARLRDELVTVNGQTMTKFELAFASTINQTIKSGKVRDLIALTELLEKHGLVSKPDLAARAMADGDKVMQKIGQIIERTTNIDPHDAALLTLYDAEEVKLVMSCERCSSELRKLWAEPQYKELMKRRRPAHIHDEILHGENKRNLISIRPLPKLTRKPPTS